MWQSSDASFVMVGTLLNYFLTYVLRTYCHVASKLDFIPFLAVVGRLALDFR
jgi:hypothetical protein